MVLFCELRPVRLTQEHRHFRESCCLRYQGNYPDDVSSGMYCYEISSYSRIRFANNATLTESAAVPCIVHLFHALSFW